MQVSGLGVCSGVFTTAEVLKRGAARRHTGAPALGAPCHRKLRVPLCELKCPLFASPFFFSDAYIRNSKPLHLMPESSGASEMSWKLDPATPQAQAVSFGAPNLGPRAQDSGPSFSSPKPSAAGVTPWPVPERQQVGVKDPRPASKGFGVWGFKEVLARVVAGYELHTGAGA